jgi:seryl-tRNA synthetase
MIDINLIRTNPELVKENIRKKFQDHKLVLVDEALELDGKRRALIAEGDALRAARNNLSKQVGMLMKEGKRDEAEAVKAQVKADADRLLAIEKEGEEVEAALKKAMMSIPNIIADDVPIGKNDEENVELQRFGEAKVPDFEIPYHLDILENLDGIDVDSARRTSGQGFYYLTGDIARLHSAVLT